MKAVYFFFIATILVVSGCKSQMDVTPDAGTQVAGEYEITNIRYDVDNVSVYNYIMPSADHSGQITVRRDSANWVFATYYVKDNYGERSGRFGSLQLQGETPPYTLYYGKRKVGTSDGNTFTLDYSDVDLGVTYRQIFDSKRK